MIKFKVYSIIILLFISSCSQKKEPVENSNHTTDLMRDLERFQMEGDSEGYNLKRKEIEETIKNENNKKLGLYFETHDAINTVNKGDLVLGKFLLNKVFLKADKQDEYFTMFSTSSHLGNVEYFQGNVLGAIAYWKKSADIAENHDLKDYVASTYGNIAIGYQEIGYFNNSSRYFLKAKEHMDKIGIEDENYWTNYINIANVYLTMNQANKAINYLEKTNTTISKKVKYLYYTNLASCYAKLNNEKYTIAYLDSTREFVPVDTQSNHEFLGQELSLYFQFDLKPELEDPINAYLSDTLEKSIPLSCKFNRAFFRHK